MKRIVRKVKVGHTRLLLFNFECCSKLRHGFVLISLHICIYLQTQAKNNEKEENSSDGLAEAGLNLETWEKDEREMIPL